MKRDLYAVELQNDPFQNERLADLTGRACRNLKIDSEMADYYVFTGTVSNLAYEPEGPNVRILLKNGKTGDITSVSDIFDHRLLSGKNTKYFLCYPKECR